ncbi:SDR family oxidoreductase [Vibrio parahaemolyticus]|uniref:UDP-glucose 4-epimerase family protein n=1 Tax=Vibrio parahaemolyticus TaxID=670 RepID=UPI0004D9596B|nr:SDR family oxidoreductase [Vibrio parahaemolyticus]EJG1648732.1 SDR family oxidoreductase [Vibrio parahaemolyticus]EMA2529757.1 SDR family oxidoreductase [Vibrio parahaemolyticus]KOF33497.1 UDP-glucose 4-epimerase [Vibrio parahaemolyticus]MBM5016210.1 SDR family oxidoreductase [Vibrio parahaemolyticus]MBM5126017.1 SDR family oxidoreductase [Vibrio parahaemolyticus]
MILITGSNGFLGKKIVEKIGYEKCQLLDRGAINKNSNKFVYFKANINAYEDYTCALKGCEVVVHCAARVHSMKNNSEESTSEYYEVNTKGTLNLARQAANAGVRRFIFISSIKVNGEETRPSEPFTSSSPHCPADDYGCSKSEAEHKLFQLAKELPIEIVVIRPTLVYGPGVKGNFASLLNLVSKNIPLPFGSITDNRRSLVSVENLVDLIVTCIDHPRASNQVFLVSDDNDVSTADIVSEISLALQVSSHQLRIPISCYRILGKMLNKSDVVDRLIGSLQVDITHTKDTLGWVPPQSLQEGFKQTALAFLQSKREGKK